MELKITKEKVLEAASKCSTAKATLQTLFPECFVDDIIIPKFVDIKTKSGDRLIENEVGSSRRIWLSGVFNWSISNDPCGGYILTPTKK